MRRLSSNHRRRSLRFLRNGRGGCQLFPCAPAWSATVVGGSHPPPPVAPRRPGAPVSVTARHSIRDTPCCRSVTSGPGEEGLKDAGLFRLVYFRRASPQRAAWREGSARHTVNRPRVCRRPARFEAWRAAAARWFPTHGRTRRHEWASLSARVALASVLPVP